MKVFLGLWNKRGNLGSEGWSGRESNLLQGAQPVKEADSDKDESGELGETTVADIR